MMDDSILEYNVEKYNMPIFVRAYNNYFKWNEQKLKKLHKSMSQKNMRDMCYINLPQVMIIDGLGYGEPVISLHLAKLREDEIFINDIALYREPAQFMRNGVAGDIIKNLKELSMKNSVRYISGHAETWGAFNALKKHGFIADTRNQYGNDLLLELAQIHGKQYPIFQELY
jgi:hypothetical protein